jgi:hypothetical protein
MDQVQALLTKLDKFHWSPNRPQTYLYKHFANDKPAGLGAIAYRSYGAFNLTWRYLGGVLVSKDDHLEGVEFFARTYPLVMWEFRGASLDTWLTLLSEEGFFRFWNTNAAAFPAGVTRMIHAAYSRVPHG